MTHKIIKSQVASQQWPLALHLEHVGTAADWNAATSKRVHRPLQRQSLGGSSTPLQNKLP